MFTAKLVDDQVPKAAGQIPTVQNVQPLAVSQTPVAVTATPVPVKLVAPTAQAQPVAAPIQV